MPRRSSSSSSSRSSTARSATATKTAPPKQQTAGSQVAKGGLAGGLAGGLMGSLMTGMAFGAGAEFFRQLFRNPTTGSFMMPLMISGLSAFGAHKLLKPSPYKVYYTAAVFAGTFILSKGMMGGDSNEGEYYH